MKTNGIFMTMRTLCKTILSSLVAFAEIAAQGADLQRVGWIDFNKNGVKDIYEDSSASVEARIADLLSQMTLEEKSCQLATLYGSGRVLKDAQPTAGWKNEVWKDGIGNIDEDFLHRLEKFAFFIMLVDNFRLADRKLISFTAHILDKDRQVELAPAGNLVGFGRISLFHAERDISVKLTEQPVPDMSGCDIFAFLSCER